MFGNVSSLPQILTLAAMIAAPQFFKAEKIAVPHSVPGAAVVAAQQQADYIMKTGDLSKLKGAEKALGGLVISEEEMKELEPILREVGMSIDPDGDPFSFQE